MKAREWISEFSKCSEIAKQRVGAVVALVVALTLPTIDAARERQAQSSSPIVNSLVYTHPDQLVRVEGGRKINLLCMGRDSPTVLLVSGGDSNMMVWRKVQASIGLFARVCSFDKAGFGFSDASTHSSSVGHDVDDLSRLLHAARIPRPVVLVGHSLGGEDAVLFAGRYRGSVAGMVLIDPAYSGQFRAFAAGVSASQTAQARKNDLAWLANTTECLRQAKAGRLSRATDKLGCLDQDYPDDRVLQATLDRQEMTARNQAAQLSEGINHAPLANTRPDIARDPFETQDDRDASGVSTDFGDMPLIVLTRDFATECATHHTCDTAEAWKANHDRLSKYSRVGRSVVVTGAGHVIQVDNPDVVVNAVREVVEATQRGR